MTAAPTVLHGDALDVLPTLTDASVDAIVCDPPYGLEFMGKDWDAPWRESGINADAGFSQVGLSDGYQRLPSPSFTGSTNPQCLNCRGNARGRRDGTALRRVCVCDAPRFPNVRAIEMRAFQEWCQAWATECLRVLKPGGHLLAFGGTRTVHRLTSGIEDAGFEIRDGIDWLYGSGFPKSLNVSKAIQSGGGRPEDIRRMDMGEAYTPSGRGRVNYDHGGGSVMNGARTSTAELGENARRWSGWGTALKPAREPIVVARKPLDGTVAANVVRHGTGALNIDACRIGGPAGRWPTNVILSHAGNDEDGDLCADGCVPGCPVAELDAQSGVTTSGTGAVKRKSAKGGARSASIGAESRAEGTPMICYGDTGGASRFYPVFRYQAKAPARERPKVDGISHSTVKPLALMRWLVTLVTPPGGHVLDPFAGSGTTVEACLLEGFTVTAVEKHGPYLPLISARVARTTGTPSAS